MSYYQERDTDAVQGPGEPEIDGGSVFSADRDNLLFDDLFYGNGDDDDEENTPEDIFTDPSGDITLVFAATIDSNELAALQNEADSPLLTATSACMFSQRSFEG